MPIKITDHNNNEIAWFCDDDWELPVQMKALDSWLNSEENKMDKGKYAADVGYNIRQGASGGGCVISTATMQKMLSIGMQLHLSEYPEFSDD